MKRPGPLRRGAYLNRTRKKRAPNKPLRGVSKKRAALNRKVAGARRAYVNEHGKCAVCGHSCRDPWPDKPLSCSKVVCHEISNGPLREKSLAAAFAILPLCRWCNEYVVVNKREWPEEKQLALLQILAPGRYDLVAYNRLVNDRAPMRITQDEVDAWLEILRRTHPA